MTRRESILALTAAGLARAAGGPVIESHVHLFDPDRFPYHERATYKPPAYPLEAHLKLAEAAGLAHAVVVHPEPYQDDHRSLEYAFAHEPRPGYFKGVCLFDPLLDNTPARVRDLLSRWPKRIIAMRIHSVSKTIESPGAPLRNRDMQDPRMLACWKALAGMGVGIQMHFIPAQARYISALAAKSPESTVILDHMGRPGDGTPEEYRDVLKLADHPRVIMKYSNYATYKGDLAQLARRIFDAFGPDRIIWGVLGNTAEEHKKLAAQFEDSLKFAGETDRAKIRGGNAQRLFFS